MSFDFPFGRLLGNFVITFIYTLSFVPVLYIVHPVQVVDVSFVRVVPHSVKQYPISVSPVFFGYKYCYVMSFLENKVHFDDAYILVV